MEVTGTVMTMKKYLVLGCAFLALAACSTEQQNFGEPELYPAYTSKDGVLSIPPLKLSISHPIALSTSATYGVPFDVHGTGAQTFFITRVQNGHQSEGLTDWMIPEEVATKLRTADACTAFSYSGTGLYLPLQTNRLMQCAVFTNSDGDRVIAAIGFSDTFESPDHLGSMLLVPRKKDVIVFQDVISFPVFNTWLKKQSDIFYGLHYNDNLWPPITPAAEAFYERATDQVGKMISEPSKEVADGMNELEQWANRITLD